MFQHQGIWFPDGEKHFPKWMDENGEIVDGRGTYQIRKLRHALACVKNFRVAVDVGGHVGLWSMQLEKHFEMVHAFEPVPAFRECFEKNVWSDVPNALVMLHECALGAMGGQVEMVIDPADSGGTHIRSSFEMLRNGLPAVEVRRLDEFKLQNVDFIKIDCEGYEHHVIEGGIETIGRCKPCVIVEQKPHKLGPNFGIKGTPAVDMLKELGYKVVREMGGDYIMVHESRQP